VQNGDRYAVYPFMPGTMSLHNLCWSLLRRKHRRWSAFTCCRHANDWESATLDQVMMVQHEPDFEQHRKTQKSGSPIRVAVVAGVRVGGRPGPTAIW